MKFIGKLRTKILLATTIIASVGLGSSLAQIDQAVTPEVIYGTGNDNGSNWVVDRNNGIELGLRTHQRLPASNIFNSNGDGSYSWNAYSNACGDKVNWNYDFAINSNFDGNGGNLDDYEFWMAVDLDPGEGVTPAPYAAFDPFEKSMILFADDGVGWDDNALGDNSTLNGGGTVFGSGRTATSFANQRNELSNYNVAQNSQNIGWLGADGSLDGVYSFRLWATPKGTGPNGGILAETAMEVVVGDPSNGITVVADLQPVTAGSLVDLEAMSRIPASSFEHSLDGGDTWIEGDEVIAPNEPGVYEVCLRAYLHVESICGLIFRTTGEKTCQMLVVYDPSGGFVTGGGWIDSPAGAVVGPEQWQVFWDQGFDTDTDGWFDSTNGWYGSITTNGDGTAQVEGDSSSGPFSRFDGYHDTWTGEWIAQIDVYLDPNAWALGEGFDYSVAASGSDANHQRDYIFHLTQDTSTEDLLVAGSNNTNFAPREDLETINHHVVAAAGWYTLQHHFYDAGGYLAVDLNLLDDSGTVLFTETRSNIADTIPGEVGGNRYAWFTHLTVAGGIAVDNHLRAVFPTGRANFGFVSKYKKGASVPDGNTEFVFMGGGVNFHSTAYQWLVVNENGQNAQFKGEGSVNGAGDYGFMIWAFDGANSGDADTFRIKIWDKLNGDAVVYDNGTDQALGGGNIVVHKAKKK